MHNKHRYHFYLLSSLVLTVLSGLLIDGPLYVLTVFLLQLIFASTITIVRHRDIDEWFYHHTESTYFLISLFVSTCLLYLSFVPFMFNSYLTNVQVLLFFVFPCALLATFITWYAARHMHHKKLVKRDYTGILQVSILFTLLVFAFNMVMIDRMVPEPYYFESMYGDYDTSMLLLNQQGLQETTFMQDVTEIFEAEYERLDQMSIDDAAYDPLCVFHDCLLARVQVYRLHGQLSGLYYFVENAVITVNDVDQKIIESNLSTVHADIMSEYTELGYRHTYNLWRSVFDQYDEANSFVLRGYVRLVRNSEYGSYLFGITFGDNTFDYKKMMQLNVNESMQSQAYRYHFLSGDFY